jgi:hypothetical protein
MTAYKDTDLRHLHLREQLSEAYSNNCISGAQYNELRNSAPVGLYTPNIFIRIGLALLTIIIVLGAAGLLALMTDGMGSYSGFMVIFGILCYGGLELMVNSNNHYNSGVDNILMIASVSFIASGIVSGMHEYTAMENILVYGITCVLCSYLCYRFTDALMGAGAMVSFTLFLVALLGSFLPVHIVHLPVILCCYLLYRYAYKASKNEANIFFHFTSQSVALTALVLTYLFGNFFVVNGLAPQFTQTAAKGNIITSIFYWSWTILMPVIYIGFGIRKRDIVLIRTGVLLVAVAVLTFRYYHSVMSVEAAMILGGGAFLIISYCLIQYLREPRHGFTFQPEAKAKGELNVEDMITERIVTRAGQA